MAPRASKAVIEAQPVNLESEKTIAEIRKANAEADYAIQQALAQSYDAQLAKTLAETADINLQNERKRFLSGLAGDLNNRVYRFDDEVDEDSVSAAVETLSRWHRLDTSTGDMKPYRFVISSGGGSVVHGMKLYSCLKSIGQTRQVITIGSGIVASMATVLLQAGTIRLIEPGTSFLLHEVSGGSYGKVNDIKDTLAWFDQLNIMLNKILAERSNLDFEEVAELTARKDVWLQPEEVISRGFADKIGSIFDEEVSS